MRNAFVLAAALALLSAPALAQGGSPYNSSGSQAGGPLAGQERAMGARGGTPGMAPGAAPGMAAERPGRPMMKRHGRRKVHHHRRHRM